MRQRGLSDESAVTVAAELTQNDVLRAHLDVELGIDAEDLANPWARCGFVRDRVLRGRNPPACRDPAASRVGEDPCRLRRGSGCLVRDWCAQREARWIPLAGAAAVRLVAGGALAMVVTFGIGALLGTAVA